MTDDRESHEGERKLIDLILAELDAEALAALKLVAAPHWVPASAVFLEFRADALAQIPALIEARLVRVSPSGGLYVNDRVRDRLRSELSEEEITAIARRMAEIFKRRGDVESEIEACYHELFFDPLETSHRMFRSVLAWRAEPFFAYHLVQRLLAVWQEAHAQRALPSAAHAYLRFVELTARGVPLEQEVAALEQMETGGDQLFAGFVLLRKGNTLTLLNRLKEAQLCLAQASATFEELKLPAGMSHAYRLLGRVALKRDAYATATRLFQHALEMANQAGRKHLAGLARQALADVASFTGEFITATDRYEEAIADLVSVGGRSAEANARNNYSQVLTAMGQLGPAREHASRADAIFESLEQALGHANSRRAAAQVEIEAGEIEAAEAHLQEARSIYRELGTSTGMASSTELLGQVRQILGDLDGAETRYQDAHDRYEAIEDAFGVATCLRDRGVLALERGDIRQAIDRLSASERSFQKIGAETESAATTLLLWLADDTIDPHKAARRLADVGAVIPRVYRRAWDASPKAAMQTVSWLAGVTSGDELSGGPGV